jgi:hypothetical protein
MALFNVSCRLAHMGTHRYLTVHPIDKLNKVHSFGHFEKLALLVRYLQAQAFEKREGVPRAVKSVR